MSSATPTTPSTRAAATTRIPRAARSGTLAIMLAGALAACGGSSPARHGTGASPATRSDSATGASTTASLGASRSRNGAGKPSGSTPSAGSRGAGAIRSGGGPAAGYARSARRSAAATAALTRFAACMRAHGIDLRPPNSSGRAPIFDLAGVEVSAPSFKAARASCASTLRARAVRVRDSGARSRG